MNSVTCSAVRRSNEVSSSINNNNNNNNNNNSGCPSSCCPGGCAGCRSWNCWYWWWYMLHTYAAKLVLEVFGGAGAIWGFSEVVGLRTPDTLWFWRPAALSVGSIFFVRWLLQLRNEAVLECRQRDAAPDAILQSLTQAPTLHILSSKSSDDEHDKSCAGDVHCISNIHDLEMQETESTALTTTMGTPSRSSHRRSTTT